jgi:hypothetical protein
MSFNLLTIPQSGTDACSQIGAVQMKVSGHTVFAHLFGIVQLQTVIGIKFGWLR